MNLRVVCFMYTNKSTNDFNSLVLPDMIPLIPWGCDRVTQYIIVVYMVESHINTYSMCM